MPEIKTHYRTCNICEALCGLEIQYKGKEIISIKGDPKDPLSRGHICPKAVALQDFHTDPDRLKQPIKKTAKGWVEISWEEAFTEVATKLREIQQAHGKNAVGIYLGNPNAHKLGNTLFLPFFIRALGSRNRYSASSVDQLPHHFASNYMLGHGLLLPIPDIDRTDCMIILGANPLVSNGSMMSCPDFGKRMSAIIERGGQVIVIDPRKTLTAKKASEHLFIRPESDALLLMALIHTIFENGWENLRHLEPYLTGLDSIKEKVKTFTPQSVAETTGIPAGRIRQLAKEMTTADSAILYSRIGTCTQSYGGLNIWLTYLINTITGNFDREGGMLFAEPAFDVVKSTSKKNRPDNYGKYKSRVWEFPYYNGEFPVATLADEILTEGEGQIKAMVTVAGNPILSTPNGTQLETAFESLEYYVAIDIYLNSTTRHADIILPGCSALEVAQFDPVFNNMSIRNTVKYSPPLFEKDANQKDDWEILRALSAKLTGQAEQQITPEMMLEMGFQAGPQKDKNISLKTLEEHPHGLDCGPLRPCLIERLETKDNKIHLAPEPFINDLARLTQLLETSSASTKYPFRLIGRRLLRSHNSWTHNSHRLVKGRNECTMIMHPQDANKLGIEKGDIVTVCSKVGEIKIETEITEDIMPGVVSIPHGWGHGKKGVRLTVASGKAGVSINDLTDHNRIDPLTGNAALNGVPVDIKN